LKQFLFENGFLSAHDQTAVGWTPLCYAVLGGSALVVAALLEAAANPNDRLKRVEQPLLPNIDGMTVLETCVYLRNNDAMRALIDFKADVHARDANGAAAIHWAASSDNVEAVQILSAAGCSPLQPVSTGHYPFEIAGATDSLGVLSELLQQTPKEAVASGLHAVFFFGGGSAEVVSRMIEAQADINLPLTVPPFSPLGLALAYFSFRHRWKKSCLTTFAYHHKGATPLMCSLITCSFEAAAVLLAAGANTDVKNKRGKTVADLVEYVSAPDYIRRAVQGDRRECEEMLEQHMSKIWISM